MAGSLTSSHKNCDAILQDKLYNNILVLTKFYPTSKQFNEVFKKDMFAKNNKNGFFQVSYYLLEVLNPELTKKKLNSWPVYDIKSETKLRGELLQFINELNTLYDNADIPAIMISHLISPGGVKFLKFMFKLSQLVLYEHIKRTEDNDKIMLKLKANKNNNLTQIMCKKLQICSNQIDNETRNLYKKHKENIETFQEEANTLCNFNRDLNQKINQIDAKHKQVTTVFNENYSANPDLIAAEEKINHLSGDENLLDEVQEKLSQIKTLVAYLLENRNVLSHDANNEQLDFLKFLKLFIVGLNKKNLEIPYLTSKDLTEVTDRVNVLKRQYEENLNLLLQEKCRMDSFMKKYASFADSITTVNREDSEPLAVPLEYSFDS